MPTFTQNLNEIIDTKKQIASIIKERGVDPGDTFSDYPTYLRSVMASGDIAGLDNYVSKLELSYQSYVQLPYFNSTLENYVQEGFLQSNYIDYSYLYSYVGKTVDDLILGTVDLEPYVTHTELESYDYVSEDELGFVKQNGGLKMKDASNSISTNAAYSLAAGLGIQTKNIAENGSGKYNYSISDAQAHTISTIGIGSSNDRKNAVAILSENGKMYVFGVGDYNGKGIVRTENGVTYIAKSLQEVLAEVPSYEFTYSYIESLIRGFLGSIDFGSYVTYAYLGSALSDLETDLMNDINNTPTYAYLYTYVGDALRDIDVDVDLDDYVTYTYLYTYVGDALSDIDVDVDLDDYPTFDDISDMGYITINDIPDVDLDDYVTYSYAYNTFVSYSYLGDLEEITEYILGPSHSSSPQNVYATKTELASYVSKSELEDLSYASQAYVVDYVNTYAPTPDLTPYVSKSELSECGYITMGDVSACGYITMADVPDNSAFRRIYGSGNRKLGVVSDKAYGLDENITYGTILDSKPTNAWDYSSVLGLNGLFTPYEKTFNAYTYSAGMYSLVGGINSYTYSPRQGSYFEYDCIGAVALGIGNVVTYASSDSDSWFAIGAAALGVRNVSTNWGELTVGRYSYNVVGRTIFAIGCGTGETYRKMSVEDEAEFRQYSFDGPIEAIDVYSYVRENAIEVTTDGEVFIKGIGNYAIEESTEVGNINAIDYHGKVVGTFYNADLTTIVYPDNIKSLQEVISDIESEISDVESEISGLSTTVSYLPTMQDISNMSYITMDDVSACGYITMSDIPSTPDLSAYVSKTELSACGYLTQHQDISGLVSKAELSAQSYLTQHQDISGLVSKTELSAQSYLTSGIFNYDSTTNTLTITTV